MNSIASYDHPVHGKVLIKKIDTNVVSFFSKERNETYGAPIEFKNKQELKSKIENKFYYHPEERFTLNKFLKYVGAKEVIKKLKTEEEEPVGDISQLQELLFKDTPASKEIIKRLDKDSLQNLMKSGGTIFELIQKNIDYDNVVFKYSFFLNTKLPLAEIKKRVKHLLVDVDDNLTLKGFESLEEIECGDPVIFNLLKGELNNIVFKKLKIIFIIPMQLPQGVIVDVKFNYLPKNVEDIELIIPKSEDGIFYTTSGSLSHVTNLKRFVCELRVLDTTTFPDSLETLYIPNFTGFALTHVPPNLRRFRLGNNINYSIDMLPDSIEELEIGNNISTQINKLPQSLKKLKITEIGEFVVGDTILPNITTILPTGLESLSFGLETSVRINFEQLPEGLKDIHIEYLAPNQNYLSFKKNLKNITIVHALGKITIKSLPDDPETIHIGENRVFEYKKNDPAHNGENVFKIVDKFSNLTPYDNPITLPEKTELFMTNIPLELKNFPDSLIEIKYDNEDNHGITFASKVLRIQRYYDKPIIFSSNNIEIISINYNNAHSNEFTLKNKKGLKKLNLPQIYTKTLPLIPDSVEEIYVSELYKTKLIMEKKIVVITDTSSSMEVPIEDKYFKKRKIYGFDVTKK